MTRVRKSAAAIILDVDEAMADVLGWSRADIVDNTSLDFIHPADQALAVENWMQMLGSPGPGRPLRIRHKRSDGSWLWVELTNHNLLDDPDEGCVIAEMRDISDELPVDGSIPENALAHADGVESRPMRLHEALWSREQLLHRLSEALPVGVLHVDVEGRVLYTNHRLHVIVHRERAGTFGDQLAMVLPDDRGRVCEAFEAALHSALDTDVEMRLATSDDDAKEVRQCTLSVRTLTKDNGEITGAVACVADVTESVAMRDELRLRATFDKLTRCYNRASTMDALEAIRLRADGSSGPAVVFVDLDRFKGINDHLGHAAGDEMLEIVATRLQRAVRTDDVVGRIGGDEFLVLCPGIATAAQAVRAATRVAEALRHQIRLKSAEVACRASVGVAWSPDPNTDADTLIGQADAAMYEAKRAGDGRPLLYRSPS